MIKFMCNFILISVSSLFAITPIKTLELTNDTSISYYVYYSDFNKKIIPYIIHKKSEGKADIYNYNGDVIVNISHPLAPSSWKENYSIHCSQYVVDNDEGWEFLLTGTDAINNSKQLLILYDDDNSVILSLNEAYGYFNFWETFTYLHVYGSYNHNVTIYRFRDDVDPISFVSTRDVFNSKVIYNENANMLRFSNTPPNNSQLFIHDMRGRTIHQQTIDPSTKNVKLPSISSGNYIANIKTDQNNQKAMKFIKK